MINRSSTTSRPTLLEGLRVGCLSAVTRPSCSTRAASKLARSCWSRRSSRSGGTALLSEGSSTSSGGGDSASAGSSVSSVSGSSSSSASVGASRGARFSSIDSASSVSGFCSSAGPFGFSISFSAGCSGLPSWVGSENSASSSGILWKSSLLSVGTSCPNSVCASAQGVISAGGSSSSAGVELPASGSVSCSPASCKACLRSSAKASSVHSRGNPSENAG